MATPVRLYTRMDKKDDEEIDFKRPVFNFKSFFFSFKEIFNRIFSKPI